MKTGTTTRHAGNVPFSAASHLRNAEEIAAYLEAMLEDGDARAIPIALRTVADALGGMAVLADRTGHDVR
jgi:DNA-binding phage protein